MPCREAQPRDLILPFYGGLVPWYFDTPPTAGDWDDSDEDQDEELDLYQDFDYDYEDHGAGLLDDLQLPSDGEEELFDFEQQGDLNLADLDLEDLPELEMPVWNTPEPTSPASWASLEELVLMSMVLNEDRIITLSQQVHQTHLSGQPWEHSTGSTRHRGAAGRGGTSLCCTAGSAVSTPS